MNIWITYLIIAAALIIAELLYFKLADRFNIIDKPNERSSHSTIVLALAYVLFKKKYYHLHEEYLASLKK